MRICIRAWPASLGCPSTGFSHPAYNWTGRALTQPTPRSVMSRDGEPLYLVHAFYFTTDASVCQGVGTGIPGLLQSRELLFKQREPPRSDRTDKRTPVGLQRDWFCHDRSAAR